MSEKKKPSFIRKWQSPPPILVDGNIQKIKDLLESIHPLLSESKTIKEECRVLSDRMEEYDKRALSGKTRYILGNNGLNIPRVDDDYSQIHSIYVAVIQKIEEIEMKYNYASSIQKEEDKNKVIKSYIETVHPLEKDTLVSGIEHNLKLIGLEHSEIRKLKDLVDRFLQKGHALILEYETFLDHIEKNDKICSNDSSTITSSKFCNGSEVLFIACNGELKYLNISYETMDKTILYNEDLEKHPAIFHIDGTKFMISHQYVFIYEKDYNVSRSVVILPINDLFRNSTKVPLILVNSVFIPDFEGSYADLSEGPSADLSEGPSAGWPEGLSAGWPEGLSAGWPEGWSESLSIHKENDTWIDTSNNNLMDYCNWIDYSSRMGYGNWIYYSSPMGYGNWIDYYNQMSPFNQWVITI